MLAQKNDQCKIKAERDNIKNGGWISREMVPSREKDKWCQKTMMKQTVLIVLNDSKRLLVKQVINKARDRERWWMVGMA